MSSSSFLDTTPSPTAAAATPKTASRWESDSPSPIHSPFGLTTYYSRLTCPLGGRQTKSSVSRSPLRSHAKPNESPEGRRVSNSRKTGFQKWATTGKSLACKSFTERDHPGRRPEVSSQAYHVARERGRRAL